MLVTVMAIPLHFQSCTGGWKGTKSIWHTGDRPQLLSGVWLDVRIAAAGKVLVIAYDWNKDAESQQGEIGLSVLPETGALSGYWFDSWHSQDSIIQLCGYVQADGSLSARCLHPAANVTTTGWNIVLNYDKNQLHLQIDEVESGFCPLRKICFAINRDA